MFYLIECDKDQSLCTVEDFEIVCDPDQPPILDENVDFFYGKEKYKGVVVGMSEDANLLNEKAKNLKRKRKASGSPIQSSPLPPKRSRKPKKSFSFTDEISDCQVKKPKKNSDKKNQENYTKNLQNQVKSKIHDGNKDSRTETSKQQSAVNKPVADRPAISPTKEELRMMLERQNKLLELYQSPSRQSSALSSKILQKRNESDFEDSDKEVLRAETNNAGARRYKLYFQIDQEPLFLIENLDFHTYLQIKNNDQEAYNYVKNLIFTAQYPVQNPAWTVVYRSLDGIDFSPVN
ncbi:hypothetical protein KQX54_016391 [Cotesia glomerata]|uniref:Uncharacterized protein n=1 Tax=Cotesia glomerata TaxID=32391 RepID=A0AAV7ISJ3_COTGL|nr:hypothetical protein KQX54_016391 [Cotesia glomerata]